MQKARFYKHLRTREWFFVLTIITLTRHFCYHIMQWEQWTIYGSSLDKTLLVNRKFPDKHFEVSFEKVLITTEGALKAFLKNLHTEEAPRAPPDEVPAEQNVHGQTNRVLVRGNYCDMQNSSQLHSIIDQAVSTIIQGVESARNLWTERQAVEYENMLNAAYKKVQDLEVQVAQIQESNALSRKEEDEKLVSLLCELDNARLVAEGSVADQSNLKLVEEECKRVTNELNSSKSLLRNMETSEKMARDEAEKLILQCSRMGREANELKALLHDANTNLKAKEEELLLKTKALEEEEKTMRKKEEHQKELLRIAEKELQITMKRAANLESEIQEMSSKRKEDLRQEKREQELSNHSFGRLTEQQKSSVTFSESDGSNVFSESSSSAANEGGAGKKQLHENLRVKEMKRNNAHYNDVNGLEDLEAKIKRAVSTIEKQETKIQELEEREARNKVEIAELEKKLRKTESEISSHKELLSHVHKEILEVQLSRDCLMEKLQEAERKAVADMLRIKVSLEETMFSQKCEELVAAVVVLLNKVVKLESFFQLMQSKIKSNLEVSTIIISALNIELSCSKEVISNLQDAFKKVENENDAAGSQIKSITTRFSDLNDQLKHETKLLEMQIAPLVQENEDLNALILLLQHKYQESSHLAKAQEKKLKEGLSRRRELEKEAQNLKAHLKEMRARESTTIRHREKTPEATHHALQDMARHHRSTSSCAHFFLATFFAISFIGFWWILWQEH